MKRLIVSGSICALWLLSSCAPGEGTVASCGSAFVGSIEGMNAEGNPVTGPMIGRLDPANLRLEVVVKPDGSDRSFPGSASLDEDGVLKTPFTMLVSGEIDLEECTASGTYNLGGFYGQGTWRLALPDAAF